MRRYGLINAAEPWIIYFREDEMNSTEKSGPSPWIATIISIISLTFSIGAFTVSFFNFYYTQLYSSEALDALLLDHRNSANDMVAHLVLINKGNQNIVITNLWFFYPSDERSGPSDERSGPSDERSGGFQPALRNDTDELICPILIEPHEVKYVQARQLFRRTPRVGQPNPSREGAIDIPVTLVFTTIGSSSKLQTGELPSGSITVKDGKYLGWARETSKPSVVQVRK
jgi:hypothetical protein